MKRVTESQYYAELKAFIAKHGKSGNWYVDTGKYDGNTYTKTYVFEDGAQFIEVNQMEGAYETITPSLNGTALQIEIPVIEHEYWDTDNSSSRIWFEVRSHYFTAKEC